MCKKKVVIRVDGNTEIGLGHISRCCALAEMLKNNFDIYFYTRANEKKILDDIKNYCSEIVVLDNQISYDKEGFEWISVLQGNEIVVLDGYNFSTNYQKKIKEKGCNLVCIDDIHAYHFIADVVINHAPGINAKDYSIEPYTKLYLGTDYILLKGIFLAEAEKPYIPRSENTSVLICFGGADPTNITGQVLKEILQLLPEKTINVIVGAAYNYLQELKTVFETNERISIYVNIKPEKILCLMQQSGIAITSASTVALEYICVKGNLFLKQTADNQKDLYNSLIEKKCASPYELLEEDRKPNKIINNQSKLINGKSNELLLKIFTDFSGIHLANKLKFIRSKNKDADLLFEWINDPEVRAQSLNNNLITYDEHANWFFKKLADKNCYLYIVYNDNAPAGMIRFDMHADECTISYLVAKPERGKGIGTFIIKYGIEQFKKDSGFKGNLKAEVKKTNTYSLKIFEKIGFGKGSVDKELIRFKTFI